MPCTAEQQAYQNKLAEAAQKRLDANEARDEAEAADNDAMHAEMEAQSLYAVWQECEANEP